MEIAEAEAEAEGTDGILIAAAWEALAARSVPRARAAG